VDLVGEKNLQVVLDVSRVGIINSSGLGMLIKGASTMKEAGGALKLAGASDKILELIKITKLTGVLQNFPTVADAVASFTK
jgi:anti-sigma B factor antagonist